MWALSKLSGVHQTPKFPVPTSVGRMKRGKRQMLMNTLVLKLWLMEEHLKILLPPTICSFLSLWPLPLCSVGTKGSTGHCLAHSVHHPLTLTEAVAEVRYSLWWCCGKGCNGREFSYPCRLPHCDEYHRQTVMASTEKSSFPSASCATLTEPSKAKSWSTEIIQLMASRLRCGERKLV